MYWEIFSQSRPNCLFQRKGKQAEPVIKPGGASHNGRARLNGLLKKLKFIANPAEAGAKAHRFFNPLRPD
jgi:hypothetical protein